MSSQDASELVVAGSGDVYVAPFGTTLPTTVDAALDGNFFKLGYTTEDGLQLTQTPTIEEFMAWQSRHAVRRSLTALEVSLTFGLEQWNETTLQTALGGGSVTEYTSGKFKYVPVGDTEELDNLSVVAAWSDGSKSYRLVIPKCTATESVEIQLQRTALAVLPVTVKVSGQSGVAPYTIYTNDPSFTAGS
jgi:hypothetical protein